MIIVVPKERARGETRVSITPDVTRLVRGSGATVHVERGAGDAASFTDEEYRSAGAEVVDTDAIWRGDRVIVMVGSPPLEDVERLDGGGVLIGMLQPLMNIELVVELARRGVTAFSLDALPRITRAQSMDALSSMSTVAGYKAVLLAAAAIGRFFPMLVTAAGTIVPARALVLGAGVAGLQAIATARRLGARVSAFDVRPVVKEQVESLGASFLAVEAGTEDAAGAGGYARELSEEHHRRELELIHRNITEMDVVITTALIPGKKAPVLITAEMVAGMKRGAVIVDLAAEMGGNCTMTVPGRDVVEKGVTIMGPVNLPATMPEHASRMYARNVAAFLANSTKNGEFVTDFDDTITSSTCITRDGRVVHEATVEAIGQRIDV